MKLNYQLINFTYINSTGLNTQPFVFSSTGGGYAGDTSGGSSDEDSGGSSGESEDEVVGGIPEATGNEAVLMWCSNNTITWGYSDDDVALVYTTEEE